MTTEELKIKISALIDTGSFNQAKKEISKFTEGTHEAAKETKATSNAMEELADTMSLIANLRMGELLKKSLGGVKKETKVLKAEMAALKNLTKQHGETIKVMWGEAAKGLHTGNIINDLAGALEASFDGLKKKAEKFKVVMKQLGVVATTVLANIAKSLAGTAIGIGLLAFNSVRMSALAKQTNVLAQQAGMNVRAYQQWAFVLRQVGLEVDDMIGAQQTLLEAQVDVREGTEDIIEAFKQIGLSEKDVMGMNQQQLFEKTVEGLQNVENATQRATLAYKLLSEDAKNLAPLLNLSSQEVAILANNFNTLNGAMSEGLIRSSNQLQSSIGNLSAAWQGLRNTLSELVLPVVIAVVNWLTKAIAIVNLFVRTIFGLDIGGAASSGVDKATSGMGGYTDSVKKATGAAQKLKRVLMGFDELNVVTNPNSGGSGSDDDAGAFASGGFGGGVTDSLFSAEALDMSKYREWFAKYKTLIQDITTWGLIGIGVGTAVIGALTGNLFMVSAGLALAGIGFAVGNVDGGTFDRLREKFQDSMLKIVPAAMVGIGAVGAVVSLLMGNVPAAIGFAALAGIGLSLGGGSDIKKFVSQFETEIKDVVMVATVAVAAAGAVICALTGNWIGAIALAGVAGLGVAYYESGKGFGDFVKNIKQYIPEIVSVSTAILAAAGAAILALSGNLPGAIAMAAVAGIAVYNAATGGNFFEDLVKGIKKIWSDLSSWFKNNVAPILTKEWWKKKFDTVREGAVTKLEEASKAIKTKWDNIKAWWSGGPGKIFTKDFWLNVFETVRSAIQTKIDETKSAIETGWSNITSFWNTYIAPKFTKQYWLDKFETFRVAISEKLNAAYTLITTIWSKITGWFGTYVAPKFTKQYWLDKFESIRSGANEKLTAVKALIEDVWGKLKTWFSTSVAPKFTVSFWSNKFGTIKDGAKAAFNRVIEVVEKAINRIITNINKLSWTVPDWVPAFGGDKFGFNFRTVSIPRLATGGIATRSTIANIGENGREAVLPLDNNTGWMDKLADRIASRSQGPSKIVLKVGERELGWATINGINQITRQTGELQLVL